MFKLLHPLSTKVIRMDEQGSHVLEIFVLVFVPIVSKDEVAGFCETLPVLPFLAESFFPSSGVPVFYF